MFKIHDYLKGYSIINILFYLIEKKYFDSFYDGLDSSKYKDEILEGIIKTLFYEGIVIINDKKVYFTDNFIDELGSKKGKGLLNLVYGYKNIIGNFNLSGNDVYNHIDLSFVGKGTNITDLDANFEYYSDFLSNNNDIKVIADLGCGQGLLLFKLSKTFPNIKFIGIDINKKNIDSAILYKDKYNMENLSFYTKNVVDIFDLNLGRIDAIIGCYIFHQFNLKDIGTLIKKLKNNFGIKHFLLKEALLDNNINLEIYRKNRFFITYYLIHILTNQNLYDLKIWKNIFLKYGYDLKNKEKIKDKIFTYLEFIENDKT